MAIKRRVGISCINEYKSISFPSQYAGVVATGGRKSYILFLFAVAKVYCSDSGETYYSYIYYVYVQFYEYIDCDEARSELIIVTHTTSISRRGSN